MDNTLVFLRHAEIKRDKNVPVKEWLLTEKGVKAAEKLANTKPFNDIDQVISSSEEKACQTAKPFAEKLGLGPLKMPGLDELHRGKREVIPKREYEEMRASLFQDLDYAVQGWETSRQALERFKKAVERIDKKHEDSKILIVSHGLVMTLYFAFLEDKLGELLPRWKKLGYCSWGTVKNGKVVKDVVKKFEPPAFFKAFQS